MSPSERMGGSMIDDAPSRPIMEGSFICVVDLEMKTFRVIMNWSDRDHIFGEIDIPTEAVKWLYEKVQELEKQGLRNSLKYYLHTREQ